LDSFRTDTKYTAPATGSFNFANKTAQFLINTNGTQNWHVALYQAIGVIMGKTYAYSFDARKLSAGTRTITFMVETDGAPYTKDKEVVVAIDGTTKTIAGTFTASTTRNVRIEIQAGLSDLDFEADNFVVTPQ
jgi:hypothetical protein